MSLRKLGASLILSVVALVTPFSSAFASGSGWDYLGSRTTYYNSNMGMYMTNPDIYSTGGYLRVCGYGSSAIYYVYEYDPDSADEKIGSFYVDSSTGGCKTFYVQNYVDGSNNRAEIYIRTSAKISGAEFWD